jgi:glycolate oxidase iron-sulfur subunit
VVKDYGRLLRADPAYAARAERISLLSRDVAEIVHAERGRLAALVKRDGGEKVAFHSPCTLQHAQKLTGVVESILREAGIALTAVPDAHLCCGSAGTYSILQPELATPLLANKLAALHSGAPAVIATANIGCLAHLQSGTETPVRHWIELLDARLA